MRGKYSIEASARRYASVLMSGTAGLREYSFENFVDSVTNRVRYAGSDILETPAIVWWAITERCNLRCEHCYMPPGDDMERPEQIGEMGTEDALRFVDQAHECNVLEVHVEGGEPFLRDDLLQIVEYLKRRRIRVKILTNATTVTESAASCLSSILDHRIDVVQVTLNGPDSEVHDRVSGSGSYADTMQGVRRLSQAGVPLHCNMVVTAQNLQRIADTYSVIAGVGGMRKFIAGPVTPVGGGLSSDAVDKTKLLLEYDRTLALQNKLRGPAAALLLGHVYHIQAFRDMAMAKRAGNDVQYCRAGRAKVFVGANGDVYGCHYLRYPELKVGNVVENHLKDIWHLPSWRPVRYRRGSDGICKHCDMERFCNKKCMGSAYAASGRLESRDPTCLYPLGR